MNHPRLLEQVLGHRLVSQEAPQVPEEALLMTPHQAVETREVALPQALCVHPVKR